MDNEFHYSLTRICLRSGQLSLSAGAAQLFPEAGPVRVLDTVEDDEFEVEATGPRTVAGLGDFFEKHGLRVNDRVRMKALPDGKVALTPIARPRSSAPAAHTDRGEMATESGARAGEEAARPWSAPTAEDVGEERSGFEAGLTGASRPGRVAVEHGDTGSAPATAVSEGRTGLAGFLRRSVSPGDAALNSRNEVKVDLEAMARARGLLGEFGYEVSGRSHGMMVAMARMGRRQHSALVRVLGDRESLDWAALLGERRQLGADYLAVFGDHRDLHRLEAPADLARATLWSWDGLERVRNIARSIPVGPFDLQPHFESGGMFGPGLERFERSVGRMVTERGQLSAVLGRLARFEAPAVFLLDDLVEDDLSREQALGMLEVLSRAPFHLVGRLGDGEFCLRFGVDEGLERLSAYALSLRKQLP